MKLIFKYGKSMIGLFVVFTVSDFVFKPLPTWIRLCMRVYCSDMIIRNDVSRG